MADARGGTSVVHGIDALDPALGRLFVVVGVFDGLHRGHHYLLAHLRREAARRGARPAVVTFDSHPDEILVGAAPPLLLDPDERVVRLAAAGVAVTVVQHFDVALRMTPYDEFVGRIARRVDLAGFLMTADAAFGHERRGTPATLAALGASMGFDVAIVSSMTIDGRPVRSTDIRDAIGTGDFATARRLLGRSPAITGRAEPIGRATPGSASTATALVPALPFALPPNGSHRVAVTRLDASAREGTRTAPSDARRTLVVDGSTLSLEPALDVAAGARLRVRLPSQGSPATIRRS